jgi:hypothetical protein
MNKEYIINEIKRTATENGGIPIGRDKFEKQVGIKINDWYGKYWTKWSDAIKEAGYEPNIFFNVSYNEELLLNKLADYVRDIQKFPTIAELKIKSFRDKEFPSIDTFRRNLGNKSGMINKIIEFCNSHTEYSDILDICLSISTSNSNEENYEIESDKIEFGFVYLIQSGKYYKVGRSNSADRRTYELKIQLPEKSKLIHQIRTDDPIGIETYWHKRFTDKRKNGEWFELSRQDINAFKRRKFM